MDQPPLDTPSADPKVRAMSDMEEIQERIRTFRCPPGYELAPIPGRSQFRSDVYDYGVKCISIQTKKCIWYVYIYVITMLRKI